LESQQGKQKEQLLRQEKQKLSGTSILQSEKQIDE
jgi:hypothetical protein